MLGSATRESHLDWDPRDWKSNNDTKREVTKYAGLVHAVLRLLLCEIRSEVSRSSAEVKTKDPIL